MWRPPQYLLVETKALPAVFGQVALAKHLLESGEAGSLTDAAKKSGISRSALYKYKDCVFAYDRKAANSVVSFYLVLRDSPGVLSAVLHEVSAKGGNVLTINQNLPVAGLAPVSLTVALAEITDMEMLCAFRQISGVEEAHRIQSQ